MVRRYFSEIIINEKNQWIYHDSLITQKEILNYFKINLVEDNDCVYIKNCFGELKEEGIIQINGYAVHVLEIKFKDLEVFFITDTQESLSLQTVNLKLDQNGKLYLIKKNAKLLKYIFDQSALTQISNFIIEKDSRFYLKIHNENIFICSE